MSVAAELHGKTPYSYSEDMLTSDVFTLLRYLPADRGIIGFLRFSRRDRGHPPAGLHPQVMPEPAQ